MEKNTELNQALQKRDDAKAKMNACKHGTKKWRKAEDLLNFWQSKVAMLGVIEKRENNG